MTKIKFGTDGWRAIIAKEYTTDNVARVARASALWVKKNFENPSVVISYDCRFGGPMFTEVAAKVLCEEGVKVLMTDSYCSTPMVSLGVVTHKASLGVVITASHNPPSYNGYKLKADFGGPSIPKHVQEVEDLIPESTTIPETSLEEYKAKGLIEIVDLEQEYIDQVMANFDMDAIYKADLKIAYDGMYGAGQNAMRRLFPNAHLLNCDFNPSFRGQAPEPLAKNTKGLAKLIKEEGNVAMGICNDGDADRIGVYDGNGRFIDSHHVILLVIHYLCKYKGMKGKIITAFSVTDKAKKLAAHYGLEQETTKIGFKYIGEIMVTDGQDVLLGGEESGGIAVKGHIPERDGIWVGIILLEAMVKTGKSMVELIDEVYEIVGAFEFSRNDLHIPNDQKLAIVEKCKAGEFKNFGKFNVQRVETTDGFKFHLSDNEWVMIRPSGTEPVLRVYAEAPSTEGVQDILNTVGETILV